MKHHACLLCEEDDLGKMSTQLRCEMERNVKVRELLFMLESDGRLCYEDNS